MKKLTKKLVMLTVCGLSACAVNAQECSIGTDTYATLDSALAAVPTGGATPTTIKLLTNINYNNTLTVSNKKITFDLNGKDLNVNSTSNGLEVHSGGNVFLSGIGNFNVTGSNYGTYINASGDKATVTNVTGRGYVAYARQGGELTVLGNVTVTNASGIGAFAEYGSKITIDGTITVPAGGTYIKVGTTTKTQNDYEAVTTKAGYFTYTDGSNTVWVKDPSIVYTITATAGTGGTISPNGTITVNCADSQTFTFSANSGYEISQVLIDDTNNPAAVTAGSYTFTNVTANHKIEVSFKMQTITSYNITATAGTGGSISPSGNISVNVGIDQTFTFSANSGYEISQVLIDNLNNFPAVAAGNYTFTNVTANHKIEVYFSPTTGISEVTAEKMTIYPNPTSGQLRVSGDILDSKDSEIRIYNVVGQVVFTSQLSKLSPETTIDISGLANGLYFLKVGGKVVKIIKE